MSKTLIPNNVDARVAARIIEEGYGPGAWHGADMKAAVADVPADLAFWRPAPGRHSIAEIALHHAWCARSVRGQLSGASPEPFVMEGEDWFPLSDDRPLGWPEIQAALDQLDGDRLEIVLGATCHAIYHAGQVQLIKRLRAD